MANGLGELTYQAENMDDPNRWAVRGDYRLRANTGNDLQRLVNGQWQNFIPAGGDYDPRTDGNTVDSNERRRFLQGFLSAPVGFDINSGGMQGVATAQGWHEPDRSGGSQFGHFLTHFALPVVGMAFGAGAISEMLGSGAGTLGAIGGTDAAALAGADAAAGLVPNAVEGASWLGNTGLSSIADAVGSLPNVTGANPMLDLPFNPGDVMDSALNAIPETINRPSWFQELLSPATNPNQTFAPWANADPALRVGSPEWVASAGQGTTMANGQLLNLPEWIAANPQSAAALGIDIPWYQQLLNAVSDGKSTASSIAKALGLGDTGMGLLNLLSKGLAGYNAVTTNRRALAANDQRLRDSKDTTPLSATSFNMLRPTALRRAKGGLAQCAECGAGSSTPRYVQGGTSGQSDKIPALLSDGEYVFDADSVAALSDGNNAAGAAALDQMRQNIRKHKRSAPVHKIPPKAKRPEHYLKGAK